MFISMYKKCNSKILQHLPPMQRACQGLRWFYKAYRSNLIKYLFDFMLGVDFMFKGRSRNSKKTRLGIYSRTIIVSEINGSIWH